MNEQQVKRLTEHFEVSVVTRADISSNDLCTEKQALKLTEAQMLHIARKMGDMMCDGAGYWDALEVAYDNVK